VIGETRRYLEMTSASELRPAPAPAEPVTVTRQDPPDAALNRRLYEEVGHAWQWTDRLPWTDADWARYVDAPDLETWVLRVEGEPAGYVELRLPPDRHAQVEYFGLRPRFIGRGLGGHLLSVAVRRAWDAGACRVWLHTSSRDHPHALENYLARGFRLCGIEER
jgi:ribosomal protein S18 acetylase RimI-like enzyme